MLRRLPLILAFALPTIACGDKPSEDDDDDDINPFEEAIDADGDGFDVDSDCDDDNADVNPDADEVCDGIDNNCDEVIDEDATDLQTFFMDADGDGYGDPDEEVMSCDQGELADNDDDCDDSDEDINPGADEICDEIDNDCDGKVDTDAVDAPTWYADLDGDGFGNPDNSETSCEQPSDYVEDDTDCNDDYDFVYPGAWDFCLSGIDTDCDPSTSSEGHITQWTADGGIEFSDQVVGDDETAPTITISEDTTYEVCEGTYYANFVVDPGVRAEFILPYGLGTATFNGGATNSVFNVTGDASELILGGMYITNGSSQNDDDYGYTAGGGIYCNGASTVDFIGGLLTENEAEAGGGLYANGCTVYLDDTEVANHESYWTAGVIMEGEAQVDIVGGAIYNNVSTWSSTRGGAIEVYAGALSLTSVDFYDNSPNDVYTSASRDLYPDLGSGVTLTCTGDGCE